MRYQVALWGNPTCLETDDLSLALSFLAEHSDKGVVTFSIKSGDFWQIIPFPDLEEFVANERAKS